MADEPKTDPVAVPSSALGAIIGFIVSGTGRRLLALLLGLVVPVLNKKLGWDLDPSIIVGDLALALSYIVASNAKEVGVAHADAKVQAAGIAAAKDPGPTLGA